MSSATTRRDVVVGGLAVAAATQVSESVAQIAQTGAGLGAATAPFTPASMTNLIGWYKADIGITSCAAGIVTAVADQSTRAHNLTTVVSVSSHDFVGISSVGYTGSLGSKYAFQFSNSGANNSGAMVTANSTTGNVVLPLSSVMTFWFIGQILNTAPAFGRIGVFGGSTGSDATSSNLFSCAGNDGSSTVISGMQNLFAFSSFSHNVNHRYIITCDGSSVYAYIDNSSVGTQAAPLALSSPTNLVIDSGWTSGALDFNGIDANICEIGYATTFLSSTQVTQLDTYLVGKWGS